MNIEKLSPRELNQKCKAIVADPVYQEVANTISMLSSVLQWNQIKKNNIKESVIEYADIDTTKVIDKDILKSQIFGLLLNKQIDKKTSIMWSRYIDNMSDSTTLQNIIDAYNGLIVKENALSYYQRNLKDIGLGFNKNDDELLFGPEIDLLHDHTLQSKDTNLTLFSQVEEQKELKKNHKTITYIHNIDQKNDQASHWIAISVSLDDNGNPKKILYADSLGIKCSDQDIREVISKACNNQIENCNLDFTNCPIYQNNKKFQQDGYNCGIWALKFISVLQNTAEQIQSNEDCTVELEKAFGDKKTFNIEQIRKGEFEMLVDIMSEKQEKFNELKQDINKILKDNGLKMSYNIKANNEQSTLSTVGQVKEDINFIRSLPRECFNDIITYIQGGDIGDNMPFFTDSEKKKLDQIKDKMINDDTSYYVQFIEEMGRQNSVKQDHSKQNLDTDVDQDIEYIRKLESEYDYGDKLSQYINDTESNQGVKDFLTSEEMQKIDRIKNKFNDDPELIKKLFKFNDDNPSFTKELNEGRDNANSNQRNSR